MRNNVLHIPNKFVYHVSLKTNRESILKNGLLPMAYDISEWTRTSKLRYPDSIFVNNQDDYSWWFYIADGMWQDINIDKYDIWKINTSQLNNSWFIDENMNDKGNYLFTKKPIPYKSIELYQLDSVCCMHCKSLIEGLSLETVLVNTANKNKSPVSKTWVHFTCLKELNRLNIINFNYGMIA
jgi:hypothetical protein